MSAEIPIEELRQVLRDAPAASSSSTRKTMQGNRRVHTGPERALRSALHAAGLRFRVDLPIRVAGRRPIRPDVVFTRARVAVFVDGCFWHGCPEHATAPRLNSEFWQAKFEVNRRRDAEQTAALKADAWTVVRVWEHDAGDPEVVRRIADLVRGSSPPARR